MKRALFTASAVIAAAATFDYANSPDRYGIVLVLGAMATFLLVGKALWL